MPELTKIFQKIYESNREILSWNMDVTLFVILELFLYQLLSFINQNRIGKLTKYINIPYTPEGRLNTDRPAP